MDIQEYIEKHSSSESEVLHTINRDTHLHQAFSHMLCGQVEGRLLAFISKMLQPKRVLELGTFTGYSALCLAEGLQEDGELITIEKNDEQEDIIRKNFSLSPLGEKVQLIIGDACEVIETLKGEFDLIFLDADKREYVRYWGKTLPLLKKDGWMIADNTLWDGHIIDPAYDKDKQTQGLRAFNDAVMQCDDIEKVILPIRDGITLIHKL